MKKVLITGANSYIGVSFENYIKDNFPDDITIDTVDMIDGSWREKSFAGYDTVFHVAGIAHVDVGNVTEETKQLYFDVNGKLPIETAKKAKADGVGQFVLMSSAIVYGDSAPIGMYRVITEDDVPMPANFYGESKLIAEHGVIPLQDDSFKVVVLRPPMVYGKGCKGNFLTLKKIAKKSPVFPYVNNQRSMIFIENLCEFVRLMIVNGEQGVFHPQNAQYSNTTELVQMIAEQSGKKVFILKRLGWLLKIVARFTGLVNKAFGSFSYDMSLSEYKTDYRRCTLRESIAKTED